MPFENFDFSDFWDDCEWAKKAYICEPPTDELIAEIEAELGYKLPESYIWLMKQHNGGIPFKDTFYCGGGEYDFADIDGILGIGRCDGRKSPYFSITDSIVYIDEGYPNIGVAICNCPSAGHDMIFLDYRECGPRGEPKVVHIDQEGDYCITFLASNFEEFIRGLDHSLNWETEKAEAEAARAVNLDKVRNAQFSPLLSELCGKCDDPTATERWIRKIAEEIVENKNVFVLHDDELSLMLYDIQFWLYTNVYPCVTQEQYLKNYEKMIALGMSFDVNGNMPAFIKNWLKKLKEKDFVVRSNTNKRKGFKIVRVTAKAQNAFGRLFSTGGYSSMFVENWLTRRKQEGVIIENNSVISMTDEAVNNLLSKRDI